MPALMRGRLTSASRTGITQHSTTDLDQSNVTVLYVWQLVRIQGAAVST
jgi:hypothetical protein